MIIDERQTGVPEFRVEFEAALRSTMRKPNVDAMGTCGHLSLPRGHVSRWVVDTDTMMRCNDVKDSPRVMKDGILYLCRYYKIRPSVETSQLVVYSAARLKVSDRYEAKGRSFKYNNIERGTVISAVCCTEVIVSDGNRDGELEFFAVHGVVEAVSDGKLWAITQRLVQVQENGVKAYRVNKESRAFVELGDGVRRAGAVHVCTEHCRGVRRRQRVLHVPDLLEGGLYEIWTRCHGFPPHMG